MITFFLPPFYEIKLNQPQGNSPLASYWHWLLVTPKMLIFFSCQERGALLLICLSFHLELVHVSWIASNLCVYSSLYSKEDGINHWNIGICLGLCQGYPFTKGCLTLADNCTVLMLIHCWFLIVKGHKALLVLPNIFRFFRTLKKRSGEKKLYLNQGIY